MSNYTLVAKVNTGHSFNELFAVKSDGTLFYGFGYDDHTSWIRVKRKFEYMSDVFSYIGVAVSNGKNLPYGKIGK